jgi:hypothetical protein
MIREDILALGLVLAAESQLRIGGLPFGPGEACLALWIVLSIGGDAAGLHKPARAFWTMIAFWALFIVGQCVGTIWGVGSGTEYDRELFLHDVMAYILLAPLSCLMVKNDDSAVRLRRTASSFVTLGTVALAAQLIQGLGLIDIPLIDPWFWERFRGWSANPNQLGLFCAILGLLALHLADTATNRQGRLAAVASLVLPVIVGRMTGSDTFTLALLATGPIFLTIKLLSWMKLPARRRPFRIITVQLLVMIVPVLLIAIVPLALSLASDHEELPISLAKNNGKDTVQEADLRLSLWYQALQTAFETGLLGLGPGPHLKIPDSIVSAHASTTGEPDNVAHPVQGAAPNFEAHNTLLDLLTQGGLIAVLSTIWLHAKALLTGFQSRSAGLLALLGGICIFGMTGLVIRHPMYWFALAICLIGQAGSKQVSATDI